MLRLEEEQWQLVRKAAAASGTDVATWLRAAVDAHLAAEGTPRPAGAVDALRLVAEVAGQLARGWVLVPGSEAGGSPEGGTWSSFLGHGESG